VSGARHVEIDRLVIHAVGVPELDPGLIADAVAEVLGRLLADGPIIFTDAGRVTAAEATVDTDAASVGSAIGRAVSGAVRGHGGG
jgi:hypothetical protein